ncbi:MAG: signal peptidase II [Ruminococcaceae bacterium]|nr:signal peptidase II [Oscillospiraceae bacterium]
MKKTIITLVSIILGGIALDQLTKILVLKLMHLGQSIELIPGVFNITYIQNEGAAFGMLSEHRWIFMITSTVAIIGIGIYLFGFCRERMTLKVGLAMIISGGVGNMIDRTAYGFVVDMIDFRMLDFWKWIFNVADALVCIGAGVVILALILDIAKESKEKKQKNENKQ